jgi:hypothetical protein
MDTFTASLDEQFALLHRRSGELIEKIRPDWFYRRPLDTIGALSCGEHILRSAATVEQTFGGIAVNLWDDPFEWTLPETLATPAKVIEYLSEVEATRKRAFALFRNDADLMKEIMAPAGRTQLVSLLLDTLVRAAHHQGAALAILSLLSEPHEPA